MYKTKSLAANAVGYDRIIKTRQRLTQPQPLNNDSSKRLNSIQRFSNNEGIHAEHI